MLLEIRLSLANIAGNKLKLFLIGEEGLQDLLTRLYFRSIYSIFAEESQDITQKLLKSLRRGRMGGLAHRECHQVMGNLRTPTASVVTVTMNTRAVLILSSYNHPSSEEAIFAIGRWSACTMIVSCSHSVKLGPLQSSFKMNLNLQTVSNSVKKKWLFVHHSLYLLNIRVALNIQPVESLKQQTGSYNGGKSLRESLLLGHESENIAKNGKRETCVYCLKSSYSSCTH
mmetsp:Transcript_3456/g.8142  ORF Transcript_3456/g.8142 Transcript_3456/m.8142 type:complete len:228 (+) Transcript_3456:730-1413(+)